MREWRENLRKPPPAQVQTVLPLAAGPPALRPSGPLPADGRFPEIWAAIVERKWDLLGHGITKTRFICGIREEEERACYREMLRITLELTGIEMKGKGGPVPLAATETAPDLLAEGELLD